MMLPIYAWIAKEGQATYQGVGLHHAAPDGFAGVYK